jgi:gamma-glutamyltranspeptidase / glutathione hydrolase
MSFPYSGVQYRPTMTGRRGMVSSAHPVASVAGLRTLMEGGNAIDAAVAVASCLGATEMGLSGIGGVGWMQIYHAKTNTHICLDYQGWSPYAAEPSVFEGVEQTQRGIKSLMVPGSPAGWCAALERFGTMDRASVFKYVIEICEEGHAVTNHAANIVNTYEPWLRDYPASMAFFFPNGGPMRPGQLHKQPDLARTFRALVEGGPDVYYRGEIADKLVNYSQANGGLLTKKDLADLTVEWVDPISIRYRDFEVYGPPPPSSAVQWLQTLKLLESYDLAGMGHNSIEHLHTLIELEKLAIADRIHYNVMPNAPIDYLLSEEYCRERRQLVDPNKAACSGGFRYAHTMDDDVVKPGDAMGMRESTTHFNVVDAEGNAVSVTQSLGGFGSGVVVPDTGILLNDFIYWFDLDPNSPNVVAPHKKNEMCLSPGMIWRDGKVFACMGTPGSHGIMETTPQFMSNLMDFGMNIQAAIEAPRVRPLEGNRVIAEKRIPQEVLAGMSERGHVVETQPDFSMAFGGAQGIMIDPDHGAFSGGGDPRRDGYAIGW